MDNEKKRQIDRSDEASRKPTRREAAQKLGQYAAFTSPVLVKLLTKKQAITATR